MIPPDHNADFVAAMEDVLEVYHRPYDPERPMVCFDEASKQLIKEMSHDDRVGLLRRLMPRVAESLLRLVDE